MDWHEAYLVQARSDHEVMRLLIDRRVPHCHQLHYLQMVCEKLAKGILMPAGHKSPAPLQHAMFVRMLQVLKGRPDIRAALGFGRADVFARHVDSLLDVARRIERLSPD